MTRYYEYYVDHLSSIVDKESLKLMMRLQDNLTNLFQHSKNCEHRKKRLDNHHTRDHSSYFVYKKDKVCMDVQ